MIVDTSVLLAYFNSDDPDHDAAADVLAEASDERVISPYVLAELDYLVATRVGVDAELAVLDSLTTRAWVLASFDATDIATAATIVRKYADQRIGLADASNVVLADRRRTRTVATLDRRHFDVLRPLGGGRFTVLPRVARARRISRPGEAPSTHVPAARTRSRR